VSACVLGLQQAANSIDFLAMFKYIEINSDNQCGPKHAGAQVPQSTDMQASIRNEVHTLTEPKKSSDLFEKCRSFTRADEIKAAGYYPYFRPIEENEGPVVMIEGRKIIMAGSNNYLGLTADPRVKAAAIKAVQKYGTGCSGSRYRHTESSR
jgi:7-keto-8-aminopelargonate synthetase-like enzyme